VDVDRMAYEEQALAVLDSIYRLALWLAPREGDARDLVQETYLRAVEARETSRPERACAPGSPASCETASSISSARTP
jgi:DNA-directed RNA polymerase specialized sigma24 family protein